MANVTLPHTTKADTDPNLFSEVKANDQAIIDQVNGNLDSTNIATGGVSSANIAANTIVAGDVATSLLTSGTYTPTLTNTANIDASTASLTYYRRVLDQVDVWGLVAINPTAASPTVCELGFSIPIASDFTLVTQAAGVAAAISIPGEAWGVVPDTVNNRVTIRGVAADVTNHEFRFTFSYTIA
jgi:hypothetical protein